MTLEETLKIFVFDLRQQGNYWIAENLWGDIIKVNPELYVQIDDIKINGKTVYLIRENKLEYKI